MVSFRGDYLKLFGDWVQVLLTSIVMRGRKNPTHWKFPERLRRARKKRQLSTAALSRAAGAGPNTVAQLEAGDRLPRLPMLERIADVLELSAGYLAFGQQEVWVPAEELRCKGLSARLIAARAACGLSLREVDRRAGTTAGVIRAIEAGGQPTLDTLESLAAALAVSPAWLAFGHGRRDPPRRRRAAAERSDRDERIAHSDHAESDTDSNR